MSSTHRGGQRSEADFYATPPWVVHRLLDKIGNRLLNAGRRWLEPCAGDGAIVRAVAEWCAARGEAAPAWTTAELRPAMAAPLNAAGVLPWIGDFFASPIVDNEHQRRHGPTLAFDVCLTNPPFSLAEAFIAAGRPRATHALFLERLNFLEGEGRYPLMTSAQPDLYVLPNRPAFCLNKEGEPATDSITYAWYHFWPGATGMWRLLDLTPLAVRKAHGTHLKEQARLTREQGTGT